nr:hypothetical protein [Leptodesmis sichuanensis]
MNRCPCCSGVLLRHIRHSTVYWFCPHCWQEMPDLAMGIETKKRYIAHSHSVELVASGQLR